MWSIASPASTRQKANVLDVIRFWITQGYGDQDLLNEPSLRTSLVGFLSETSDDEECDISEMKKTILKKCCFCLCHPTSTTLLNDLEGLNESDWNVNWLRSSPNAVTLLSRLNGLGCYLLSRLDVHVCAHTNANIHVDCSQTLICCITLFNAQSALLADFPGSQSTHVWEEQLKPSASLVTFRKYLMNLPSSFVARMPLQLRLLISTVDYLIKDLTDFVTASELNANERVLRLNILLQALSGARQHRLLERADSFRSFAEGILAEVLMSRESRALTQSWYMIAKSHNCTQFLKLVENFDSEKFADVGRLCGDAFDALELLARHAVQLTDRTEDHIAFEQH